jgi:hypothetical protein
MHQADLHHGVRGILGSNPLYSKRGQQSPHHRLSSAARSTKTRPEDQGRWIWMGPKIHTITSSAGSHRSASLTKWISAAASTRGRRRARREVMALP